MSHSHDRDWKLRIIVDSNLTTGQQFAQSAHALAEFASQFPEQFHTWHEMSNSVIVMSCADLSSLLARADKRAVRYAFFREPDLNDKLTAVCLEATADSRRLTSSLKLAN